MHRFVIIALLFLFTAVPAVGQEAPPDAGTTDAGTTDVAPAVFDEETLTTRAIDAALDRVEGLEDVEVAFGAGVATLTGGVETAGDRAVAETVAGRFDGVRYVDNRLRVSDGEREEVTASARDAAIRENLDRIFANVEELRNVSVRVRSGVVRLEGQVLSTSAEERAMELARAQAGVVYVESGLTEVRDVQERISPAFARLREVVSDFVESLPLMAVGVVIVMLFWGLAGILSRLEFPYRRLSDKPLIQGIVKQVVRLFVLGSGAILVLELFDLTSLVGAVLGTAGVAGLAVGFAFKDIVENYLASLMLSVHRPFEKNDVVQVDDYQGKVVRLTTRETVLMTLDGNHLRIPNAVVFKAIIYNYTRNPLRRFDFVVGVGSNEDLRQALELGTRVLEETPGVLVDPESFGMISELGDFAVNLQFFAWLDQKESDLVGVKSAAIRRVKEAYDSAGIDMPEPTQRVLHRPWEVAPEKPVPVMPSAEEEPAARPTEQIDAQIEADREASDEPDLLGE
jgi:small-conductance mechanosensitive channel